MLQYICNRFSLNITDDAVQARADDMAKNINSVQEIKSRLMPVFKKHKIKKAVLFGSYAQGLAGKSSDIDILVDSNLRGLAFYGLLEDVVDAVGASVDLLDASQLAFASEIKREIEATGVLIYG